MGKRRNIFNRLECRHNLPDGDSFFVTRSRSGQCRILKYDANAHMVTDAHEYNGGYFFDLPTFDSFIQAARYLKANVENLI